MTRPDCSARGCSCGGEAGVTRRDLVRLAGLGAAAAILPDLPAFAGPFATADFERWIPRDKKLSPEWLAALTARGEPECYRGRDLRYIGMPVGGLCCGTVYLGGDGRLWLWDIFNRNQNGILAGPVEYRGASLNSIGGSAYVGPAVADHYRGIEQGFTISIRSRSSTLVRSLDGGGFRDVAFTGQYPIGTVHYSDPAVPVKVCLEAFSPFIPLDLDDSSLPATILAFRLENAGAEPLDVELEGVLENAVSRSPREWSGLRCNRLSRTGGLTILQASAQPRPQAMPSRPDIVFEDWSHPTYEGWRVEGDAFGRGPVLRTEMPAYQGDVGGDTKRVVNSHASAPGEGTGGRDGRTGRLTSRPFVISRRFINLWIGGGGHPGKTCVNLVIDGGTVQSLAGRNENRMDVQSFMAGQYEGRSAVLEIVDAESGGWGNVGVGRITFSDSLPGSVEPGQQGDFGTMCLGLLGAPAEISSGDAEVEIDRRLVGRLGRRVSLSPGQAAEVHFLLAWHFPNVGILAGARRHYVARFASAAEVARYVADHFERLAGETRRWRETWYDSTLPYWFLNRTFANTSTLATTTCHRFQDGRFWAWEGVGCCAGTCTHVWHYAQAPGRLFPELERGQRERVDFGLALQEDGVIRFRAEHGSVFAADGQAGRILGVYREHQMSSDAAFLRRVWPRVRRAIERLMQADPARNGLLRGPLHNTLDADWMGYVPWLCGLYHAALRAGERMAREMDDPAFAAKCGAILEVAAASLDAACWKEESGYYVHVGDKSRPSQVGAYDGCHIDQVFGQGWAWQLGLGPVMTPARVRRALLSLWTYNFTPDVGPFRAAHKAGRWYALAGDGGTIMVTFPFAGDPAFSGEGAGTAMYFNECMSGFEHQLASHMMWEGMVIESLAITRAIHDRYGGRLRNPYNEIECSDHYARAMASYGTYLAACGFECHGPQGHLGFDPRLTPADFRAAFTAADGWGTFAQKEEGGSRQAAIEVKWGGLRLRTVRLGGLGPGQEVAAKLAGREVSASIAERDGRPVIRFDQELRLDAGQRLELIIRKA